MPTYQYVCTACDRPLEAVQSFSDGALTECPACAGRLRKVYGAVGVVFKGSGFYKNDSRKEGKASSSAPSSPAADSGSGGSGKDSAPTKDAAPAAAPAAPATTSTAPAGKSA